MIDFDAWAAQKAKAVGEEEGAWKERLHNYSQAGVLAQMTDGETEKFLRGLRSVAQLDRLQASMAEETSVINQLFEASAKSHFELSDWLDAYDYFLLWLKQNLHSAKPTMMLRYLTSSVEYAQGKPELKTLTEMLKDFLTNVGFNGKAPSLQHGK